VEELVNEFTENGSTAGFMSCMIAILYFLTIYGLEMLGSSTICRPWFRGLLADYAYVVCTNEHPMDGASDCYRSVPSSGLVSRTSQEA
jgi:hypothetical protein